MSGTTTYTGRVWSALYMKSQLSNYWFSVGYQSAWPDENNPPAPDPDTDSLTDIVGVRKIDQVETCILDDASGTIVFRDHKYTAISGIDDAYTMGANYVYMKGTIYYDWEDFPVGVSYRQVGLWHGLVLASGVSPGTEQIAASGVNDYGRVLYYSNESPVYRAVDKKDIIELILEIR